MTSLYCDVLLVYIAKISTLRPTHHSITVHKQVKIIREQGLFYSAQAKEAVQEEFKARKNSNSIINNYYANVYFVILLYIYVCIPNLLHCTAAYNPGLESQLEVSPLPKLKGQLKIESRPLPPLGQLTS